MGPPVRQRCTRPHPPRSAALPGGTEPAPELRAPRPILVWTSCRSSRCSSSAMRMTSSYTPSLVALRIADEGIADRIESRLPREHLGVGDLRAAGSQLDGLSLDHGRHVRSQRTGRNQGSRGLVIARSRTMAVVRWYPSVSSSTATPAAARGASSARDKAESSVLQEVGMTCTRRDRPPSLARRPAYGSRRSPWRSGGRDPAGRAAEAGSRKSCV